MILQPFDADNALPVSEDKIQCIVLSKMLLHSKRVQKLQPTAMQQDNYKRNYREHPNILLNACEVLQTEKGSHAKAVRYL